jgi:hypothetical protein
LTTVTKKNKCIDSRGSNSDPCGAPKGAAIYFKRKNYFANRIIILTNVIDFEERRSNSALIRSGISIK